MYLETHLALPPGSLPSAVARDVIATCVELGWATLVRYGRVDADTPLPAERPLDAVIELYDEKQSVVVGSRSGLVQLLPNRRSERSHTGEIALFVSPRQARSSTFRDAHAVYVAELMQEVGSPYAFAALDDDVQRKTMRDSEDDRGTIRTYTVKSHADGLAGLFWRNFFGPPFVDLFRDRLADLPTDTCRELPGGIVLVEPYASPDVAATEKGRQQESQLIATLGKDAFYDHDAHRLPSRRPKLADKVNE